MSAHRQAIDEQEHLHLAAGELALGVDVDDAQPPRFARRRSHIERIRNRHRPSGAGSLVAARCSANNLAYFRRT